MESFLRGEISTSSSRIEPRNNLPARIATPRRNELPAAPVIDVAVAPVEPVTVKADIPAEIAQPVVDQIEGAVPVALPAESKSPTPTPCVPETSQKPNELNMIEQMLRAIQEMVEGNHREIQGLKNELDARRDRHEDTSRIEALLAEEERKSQELLGKLAETEGRLATSEAENRSLSNTVRIQDALLERKNALKFTDEELAGLLKYSAIIIFDTCSIMNFPNLLDGVNDGELVVVPKDVNNELEHHKSRFGADERKIKAQKAITAIFNYKRRYPLIYAESMLDLIPEVYRAGDGEREQNDNKILAVALRYKLYSHVPVIFITDDRSLSNKAAGEGLEVWTAKDFLTPPAKSFEDEPAANENQVLPPTPVPETQVEEVQVEHETNVEALPESTSAVEAPAVEVSAEEILATEVERRAKAREEFLAQKISAKLLHLEASQISVLQKNGIKTVSDFLAQTESSFSSMKAKKGLTFTARFMKEQETLRRKLESQ